MLQAMKIPDAKAAVDKEWKKLETIAAWDVGKVNSQKEVTKEAQKNNNKVPFASLMDLCLLKNSESEPQFQKYKGRVVLGGDSVKEDSGAYAVFTEQGSSASQMTAAKVMDVIARVPDCDGQAADAISAYTQVRMEGAQKLLEIPKSECPDVRIRLPKHEWPESSEYIEDLVVPLERNLYGHPLECLFVHRKQKLFLSVSVDDIKMVGKTQNVSSCVEDIDEETLILRNQHHFLITFTQDALNGNANPTRKSLDNTTKCLNPVLLLEQPRNYQEGTNLAQKLQLGSYDKEGHARKCVERYCELANKKTEQLYKDFNPCLDDHQI